MVKRLLLKGIRMGGNRHQRECGRSARGTSRSATARFVIGALLGAAVGVAAAVAQQPQEGAERTVQSGVFAAAQAERGQNSYASFCQACHGADLRGANARPLTGPDFMRNWRGLTLADLFDRFQTNAAVRQHPRR